MIGGIIAVVGALFLLIAAIGVVRLRDPLQRMHAATKAGTLGAALIMLGAILAGDAARPATGVLTVLFLLATLPVGAQLLGRAAYRSGTRLEGLTGPDPLEGELDRQATPLSERIEGTD